MSLYIKNFFILILLLPVLRAGETTKSLADYPHPDNKWTFRLHGGYATVRPMVAVIILGDIRLEKRYTSIRGLDIGRNLVHDLGGKPLDLAIRIGLIHHDEKGFQSNYSEYNIFLLSHYRTTYRGFKMRWFLGEGLSYAERVPYVEGRDTRRLSEERDSQLMNYMNVGFDFSIGRLLQKSSLNNLTVGFAVSHRSGIFGAFKWFNNTSGGGNYNTLFLEYKL